MLTEPELTELMPLRMLHQLRESISISLNADPLISLIYLISPIYSIFLI